MQSISGLAIVLAVIAGLYWLMTRLRRGATARTSLLKMISGMQVGAKERIVLVELGDSWLLLGVAPGQVNTLHSMPKMELPADSGIAPMKTFAQLLDSARGKNAR